MMPDVKVFKTFGSSRKEAISAVANINAKFSMLGVENWVYITEDGEFMVTNPGEAADDDVRDLILSYLILKAYMTHDEN